MANKQVFTGPLFSLISSQLFFIFDNIYCEVFRTFMGIYHAHTLSSKGEKVKNQPILLDIVNILSKKIVVFVNP